MVRVHTEILVTQTRFIVQLQLSNNLQQYCNNAHVWGDALKIGLKKRVQRQALH